jgi:hypothetical protein
MNRLYKLLSATCLILICCASHPALAGNSPAFEQRRTNYIDTAMAHFSNDALPIQAYLGLPLDTAQLNFTLNDIRTDGDADFRIVQAVRVLFFTHGVYDSAILSSLNYVPYWINKGDTSHVYWSENHMMMWMSSDWLLHESYGKVVDTSLHNRLVHYLQLKLQFGFYEFNSSVYNPYCLSGLLNLVDFAQDAQIKALATQAAQKLMAEYIIRLTNDKGVMFPTAGRNYYGKYETPYGQNHNDLIWLFTGLGQVPGGSSHCGAFLSTSTLPVDTVTDSWSPYLDTVYYNGHTLDTSFVLNANQDSLDKTIFHWSSGAYFPPQTCVATGALLTDSSLWQHIDFQPFAQLRSLPLSLYVQISQELSSASESSVISGETIAIFKHKSITLSSLQDFWKGKLGYQQFPVVANVGTTAVFTASGKIYPNWNDRNADFANEHLPYVKQDKNVALIMYRPEPLTPLLNLNNPEVALHWHTGDFDEVHTDSLWLIGRQGSSYAAARMYCNGEIDSLPACYYVTDGQAYVIVVGDSDMYGSFARFQTLIHQSQFSEQRYFDSVNHKSVYFAQIVFDTATVNYAWANDSFSTTGIREVPASPLHVYPNPATDLVTLTLDAGTTGTTSVQVTDVMGQTVYTSDGLTSATTTLTIDTRAWPPGIYLITGQNANGRFTQKVVKGE